MDVMFDGKQQRKERLYHILFLLGIFYWEFSFFVLFCFVFVSFANQA